MYTYSTVQYVDGWHLVSAEQLFCTHTHRCCALDAMHSMRVCVQHQAMARHGDAWKESLRERPPPLDAMCGLRRITLNANPLVDDRGAIELADALQYVA